LMKGLLGERHQGERERERGGGKEGERARREEKTGGGIKETVERDREMRETGGTEGRVGEGSEAWACACARACAKRIIVHTPTPTPTDHATHIFSAFSTPPILGSPSLARVAQCLPLGSVFFRFISFGVSRSPCLCPSVCLSVSVWRVSPSRIVFSKIPSKSVSSFPWVFFFSHQLCAL